MTRCAEFFDINERCFKVVVESNDASSELMGISLDHFARTVWAGAGMFQVAPIYWTFDKTYWPKLTKFLLGSVFRQPSSETDIVVARNARGEAFPCLVHFFASYDAESGARSAVSYCARPLSPGFNPILKKFLLRKANMHQTIQN
jgi:hypothetical protein